MQPAAYLCHSLALPPTLATCFYLETGNEIHGWYLHSREHRFGAAFFMLENFYAPGPARLYRSKQDDVYGPWVSDYPRRRAELSCPLPEFFRHELERLQSLFVQEWLFFENDPGATSEITLYERHDSPVCAVNIKHRKLHRLSRQRSCRECRLAGFDMHVLEYLQKHLRVTEIETEKWRPSLFQRTLLQSPRPP